MTSAASSSELTAVICTYNRYECLEKAVQSLRQQSLDRGRFHVIVVDNSPDYDMAIAMRDRYLRDEFVEYLVERTPGLSNARNVALRHCRTPYICYLDDDAVAHPQWLEKVSEAFAAFPGKAGIVGGKINPIWAAPRPTWLPDSLLGCLTIVDWGGSLRIAKPNEWVAGANISFVSSILAEIGGFPVSLGRVGSGNTLLSNEEIYVLEQMRKRGLKVAYAPDAQVDHLVDINRLNQSWLRKRMAWQAVSDFLKNSEVKTRDHDGHWEGILSYFNSVPPKKRTPRGVFEHCQSPDEFARQIGCIYNLTMLLLEGIDLAHEA